MAEPPDHDAGVQSGGPEAGWSGSQAGWVNVLAAWRDPSVKFLMLSSGEVLSTTENFAGETEMNMAEAGFSPVDQRRAGAAAYRMLLALQRSVRSGDWTEVDSLDGLVRSEAWYSYVASPRDRTSWNVDWLARNVGIDFGALWEQTRIPVLAIYGGRDQEVKASRTVPRLERYLQRAGNRDYTLKVLPLGDHEGLESETGFFSEYPRARKYTAEYWPTMRDWLLAHIRRAEGAR